MAKARLGGSFAPPINSDRIAAYRELAKSSPDERIRDAMLPLCSMVESFYQTPRSTAAGKPHPTGVGVVVPLEEAEIKRIWDLVPYDYECDALGTLFSTLPDGCEEVDGEIVVTNSEQNARRNAAFHLLWFARELTRDREPITNDLL